MRFTPITTQEEFDERIKDRLERQSKKYEGYTSPEELEKLKAEYEAKSNEKNYKGYTSPDDLEKIKEGYQKKIDELKTSNQELNASNAKYKLGTLKNDIAYEFGIPHEMASRLVGENENDIRKDAESLSKFITSTNVQPLGTNETPVSIENSNRDAYKRLLDGMEGE